MTVAMSGRQLAYAALWANGASVKFCAEIMGVSTHTVQGERRRIRRKYASEGITIANGVQAGQVLAEHPPWIRPPRRTNAPRPAPVPGRGRGRPTVITPERLTEALRLRAEGMSYQRIAAQLGVGNDAVRRAVLRAEESQRNA